MTSVGDCETLMIGNVKEWSLCAIQHGIGVLVALRVHEREITDESSSEAIFGYFSGEDQAVVEHHLRSFEATLID